MPPKASQLPRAEAYDIKMIRRVKNRALTNQRRSEQDREAILCTCDVLIRLLESDPDFGERRMGVE